MESLRAEVSDRVPYEFSEGASFGPLNFFSEPLNSRYLSSRWVVLEKQLPDTIDNRSD
jgi:hypothetical protein